MKGIDVSHHQGSIDWKKVSQIEDKDGKRRYQFAIVKCSQGTTFRDNMYHENKKQAKKYGFVFGAYHFANASDPIKEADHFCDNVGDLDSGDIVVLDYETNALADPATWCKKWLDKVEERLGFKPMLYTYHEFLKKYDWTKVSKANFGLWAARYGMQTQEPIAIFKPATGSWDFYALWQYCSRGKVPGIVGNVDLNTTDMDVATLKKYGKPAEPECNHSCPKHCDQ